jgi:hypothetical protein
LYLAYLRRTISTDIPYSAKNAPKILGCFRNFVMERQIIIRRFQKNLLSTKPSAVPSIRKLGVELAVSILINFINRGNPLPSERYCIFDVSCFQSLTRFTYSFKTSSYVGVTATLLYPTFLQNLYQSVAKFAIASILDFKLS